MHGVGARAFLMTTLVLSDAKKHKRQQRHSAQHEKGEECPSGTQHFRG